MKNYIRYSLLIVCLIFLWSPVCTQGHGTVTLTMAPIIAAVHTVPDPVPPPPPVLPPVEWPDHNKLVREWQQNDDGSKYDWDEAIQYCDNLVLNGYSDWKLPDLDELKSIVVCSNGTPTPLPNCHQDGCVCGDQPDDPYEGFESPVIDKAFAGRPSEYWTSKPVSSTDARRINFERGGAAGYKKSAEYYVRCIRRK